MPLSKQVAKFPLLIVASIFLCISTVGFAQVVEKNYFSTDKDIYAPKDTIWFKGYIFDTYDVLSSESLAYHVLMVDAEGNKTTDTTWPINDGVTNGYFLAPRYEGRFKLIAVSGQMIGSESDQVFNKDIFVRSELSDEIQILAFPQFESYREGQENLIDIFTRFSTNNSAPEVQLSYTVLSNGKTTKKRRLRTSEAGKVVLDLQEIDAAASDITLILESEDNRLTKPIKLAVPIPIRQQKIDLQFFPEGGNLINGIVNKVAFKAIDENGQPFNFKGLIVSSSGEVLSAAESFYKGMGSLKLIPQENETYSFQVNEPFKIDSLYELPKASKSGISLSISDLQKNGKQYAVVRASDDLKGKSGKFIISKGNQTISALDFNFSTQDNWELAYENLGVGVYNLQVTDQNNTPLSERLLFANPQQQLNINIKTDKKAYQAREKTEVNVTITDYKGMPVQGNFSLTAVDSVRTKSPIGNQPNLLGQVLLASHLKGNIPTPNFYFTNDEKATKALDLVMMTNGWRKYTASNIDDPEGISGSLHRMNSKRRLLKDREVVLTSLNNGGLEYFEVDTLGIFRIPYSYLKNKGDSFLVISNKMSKKDKFSLRPNQSKRIQKSTGLRNHLSYQSNLMPIADNLIFRKQHKLLPDRFQNVLLLNSVVVEGNKRLPNKGCKLQDYHFEEPWTTKTVEELDMTDVNLLTILKQVSPIVHRIGNWRTRRVRENGLPDGRSSPLVVDALLSRTGTDSRSEKPMRVQINCEQLEVIEFKQEVGNPNLITVGNYFAQERLNRIDWSNIESISINSTTNPPPSVRGDRNYDFSDAIFPIVNINTINDQLIYKPFFDMKFYHSAYQNYTKEFYSPAYETEKKRKDPVPDLRTTIFWQANVFTDENGQATITYYNADRPNQIGITVEGVDAFSRLGYGSTTYQVLEGSETEEDDN